MLADGRIRIQIQQIQIRIRTNNERSGSGRPKLTDPDLQPWWDCYIIWFDMGCGFHFGFWMVSFAVQMSSKTERLRIFWKEISTYIIILKALHQRRIRPLLNLNLKLF